MDCKLKVFKNEVENFDSAWAYRFVVIDYNKSKSFPANFVCMLPIKIVNGKGKAGSVFRELFGDKSLDLAVGLLNDALKHESDVAVKIEIERRLKLIDPKQVNVVKCSQCKKIFLPRRIRKYKQNLCDDCLKARYGQRHY